MQREAVSALDVQRAAALCRGRVTMTPLEPAPRLGDALDLRLKLECFQPTGSFKIRGALVGIARHPPRSGPIVTASAGNHALAVGAAAAAAGARARIFVPASADPAKLERLGTTADQVEVTVVDGGYDDVERAARTAAEREAGARFLSSSNDPDVIAGQGTIGLELLEQWPEVEAVVVPVGGGGLIAGIGVAVKSAAPWVRIVGAEPAASPALARSLSAGRVVRIRDDARSIAEGLVGNLDPDTITLPLIASWADEVVPVGEDDIASAVARLYDAAALVVEPSGAAGLAALPHARALRGLRRVACVITGRNIAASAHRALIDGSRAQAAGNITTRVSPSPPPIASGGWRS